MIAFGIVTVVSFTVLALAGMKLADRERMRECVSSTDPREAHFAARRAVLLAGIERATRLTADGRSDGPMLTRRCEEELRKLDEEVALYEKNLKGGP